MKITNKFLPRRQYGKVNKCKFLVINGRNNEYPDNLHQSLPFPSTHPNSAGPSGTYGEPSYSLASANMQMKNLLRQ